MNPWYWCELCQNPCIKCEACKHTSCTGGGCQICYDDFEEVTRMIEMGKAPKSPDQCVAIIHDEFKKLLDLYKI